MEQNILLDKAFQALANEKRRSIITSLALQPLTISKLAEFTDLSLPAIHKHIKILESAQLINRRKIGRSNYLVLEYESMLLVQSWLLKHHAHWGSSAATFENYSPSQPAQQSNVTPDQGG